MARKLAAEFLGTFMLVAAVCGCSLIAFDGADGASTIGISLGAGLSLMAMTYAVGPVSGSHFNPAITLGAWAAGRFGVRGVVPYIFTQVLGGACAALVFYIILSSRPDWSPGGFASNGYGAHSPGGYSMSAVLVTEVIQTALFVFIFLRVTRSGRPGGFAPIAIGAAFAAMHLVSLPVANTSLNPARSTATALFAEGWALQQLWLFWAAPVTGAIVGGVLARWLRGPGRSNQADTT